METVSLTEAWIQKVKKRIEPMLIEDSSSISEVRGRNGVPTIYDVLKGQEDELLKMYLMGHQEWKLDKYNEAVIFCNVIKKIKKDRMSYLNAIKRLPLTVSDKICDKIFYYLNFLKENTELGLLIEDIYVVRRGQNPNNCPSPYKDEMVRGIKKSDYVELLEFITTDLQFRHFWTPKILKHCEWILIEGLLEEVFNL